MFFSMSGDGKLVSEGGNWDEGEAIMFFDIERLWTSVCGRRSYAWASLISLCGLGDLVWLIKSALTV